MTDAQRRAAAKRFIDDWAGRGDEKQETQPFWLAFLRTLCGVDEPEKAIAFELPVKVTGTNYIDAYMRDTRVLIEQKGRDIDLKRGYRQSDGALLTPFQQARRYAGYLPHELNPRWILICNFREFHIHDMNNPNGEPEVIRLSDLEREYHRFDFLTNALSDHIRKEMEVSIQAGELVGRLYDAFYAQYIDPQSERAQRSLNMLCVRLVFCLYAEDAGIFGSRTMFKDYMHAAGKRNARRALIELFETLNTPGGARDPYIDAALGAFPYVNGELFADGDIEIPQFTDEIMTLLIQKASTDFDWSVISPTIFGAVFESTLNPETRRKGGMHYTSIENIHKLIDPLFLDELKREQTEIGMIGAVKTRAARLREFQHKLARLKFMDPACGSGNFLTETYICLRRMENEVIRALIDARAGQASGQIILGLDGDMNPIKVSISQFYGIEINDFAVTVAKTALWIAESQMMKQTEDVVHMNLDFLPLKSYANIVEGNALRLNWEEVAPVNELKYIMGNPPFLGYGNQSAKQKDDILSIYVDESGKPYKTAGKIDYVAGWYFKAAQLMRANEVRAAFVSTNSITQGEQVAGVWKPLYDRFNIHIDFAHRTFRWNSEAINKAHVHCVIVGFSCAANNAPRIIFSDERYVVAENINAYLVDAPNVFIQSRVKPLCSVHNMSSGNRPADGGHLIIEEDEYEDFIAKEPLAAKYIKRLSGATEFINNKKRWCLWLVGVSPSEIRKMPEVMKRIELCRADRLNGADDRKKLALTPTLFRETNIPESAIVVPRHSSQNRKYIPFGFIGKEMVLTDAAMCIPNATLYEFGILESNVHMAWTRAVCGRIKSDYRYSKDIVYNNFPWPSPTDAQREKIAQTARGILDARAMYDTCSLADLYDELTMPPELRSAHQRNDRAVMEAYGFSVGDTTESGCVAMLMEMHAKLAEAAR